MNIKIDKLIINMSWLKDSYRLSEHKNQIVCNKILFYYLINKVEIFNANNTGCVFK